MDRRITYVITKEYEGKKVYEFLRANGFSRQNLTDIKYNLPDSMILANGKRVLMNHVLSRGEEISVVICEKGNSENIVPTEMPLEVIYEDEDIIVINKPSDMPIHPSLNNYSNTLGNALMYYYNSQGIDFIYRVINRLDRDTSGLTVVAKNIISANILHNEQKVGKLKKEYTAIVVDEDNSLELEGTICRPIGRKEGSTIERIIDDINGERAITHYRVIDRYEDCCLIKLNLETGRTHQIRVHMKSIGHPLVGDFLYNPDDEIMQRQALHVSDIEFIHPITGVNIRLNCSIPADMNKVINDRRQA